MGVTEKAGSSAPKRSAGEFVSKTAASLTMATVVTDRTGRTTAKKVSKKKALAGSAVLKFRHRLRDAALEDRVQIEREGVAYNVVVTLIDEIGSTRGEFQSFTRMPKATFNKKMKERAPIAGTAGHSVLGLIDLINKVEDMLAADPDNPEAQGFDVVKWVGEWIHLPQPALGGAAPVELMDTPTGRASVMRLLGAMQSGAYL